MWIYGGGEQGGGIQNPLYDGCNLAAHDTLVVSISYRLGPIGFLTLGSAGIAGNFGIQDLVLGLEWVQSNIASFGGDPVSFSAPGRDPENMLIDVSQKKVLLFGESAGASNTFLISTLPNATSLINAAVWESGAGPQLATSDVANTLGAKYATTLNCSTSDVCVSHSGSAHPGRLTTCQAACLRAVSTSDLQKNAPEAPDDVIYSRLSPTDFQPHVDGTVVPKQPWSAGTKVPMIFGSNQDEGGLFTLGAFQTANVSASQYSTFLDTNFGAAASIVGEQYPLTMPAFAATGFPAFAAISTIITEALFHCPAYQAMMKAQSQNIPVYAYFNSHTPSCQWLTSLPARAIPYVGATHTSDVPFIFGNLVGLPLPDGNCSMTAEENAISENLIAAWTAMAATRNPSVAGSLQWPQWNNNTNQGLTIVNATAIGTMDYSQCAFWDIIDNTYLNFTSFSNSASGNISTGSGKPNAAGRGVELGVWGLTLTLALGTAVLIATG